MNKASSCPEGHHGLLKNADLYELQMSTFRKTGLWVHQMNWLSSEGAIASALRGHRTFMAQVMPSSEGGIPEAETEQGCYRHGQRARVPALKVCEEATSHRCAWSRGREGVRIGAVPPRLIRVGL